MIRSVWPRLGRRLCRDDAGFTLVEVSLALFVIGGVLLALITVQVQALESVGLSKQRQQATALANRTMEQLRALPYDTVRAGLNSTDLTGDPSISFSGSTAMFTPAYDAGVSEVLQTSSGQSQPPLYPHTQDATTPGTPTRVDNVQYTVRTYVSQVDPTVDQGFHLSVTVAWSSAVTGGATKMIAVRSRVFSPAGCSSSSTATRPFAGPCQAFFYSDAGTASAGITVIPVTEGDPLVSGIDAYRLEASTPSLSTRTQNEQVVSAQSVVSTSALAITTSSGQLSAGGQSATSAADTDPSSGVGNAAASASTVNYAGGTSVSANGTTGSFSAQVPSSASGSVYSTTAATASPPCADDTAAILVTSQACSTGEITPSGTYRADMALNLAGRDLGSTLLGSISSPATPADWRAFGARAVLPLSGHCASTSGIGCVASGVTRAVGPMVVGDLPTPSSGATLPPGFTSMVSLDGMTATAGAESGIDAGTPTSSRSADTLRYWNGGGYTEVTLDAAGVVYPLGRAVGTYATAGLTDALVTLTGTVTVDPVSSVTTGSAPCKTTACTSTATVGTVRAAVQYDITIEGVSVGHFVVTADLGSTTAQTTYKAAPDA